MSKKASVVLIEKDGALTTHSTGYTLSALIAEAKAISRNPPKGVSKVWVLSEARSEFYRRLNRVQPTIKDGDAEIVVESGEAIRVETAPKGKKA